MGIVRGHHGAVEVSSQPETGTRFKILLPAAGTIAVPAAPASSRPAWHTGTETILVIEDEAPVRRLTARILSRAGYTVLLAATGAEGIELFKSKADEIDLVLLDFIMAPMSGEDVYHVLRQLQGDVNVLLTSGYSREEVAKRLCTTDFQFIQKPYEPAELTMSVRGVLERRALA
jgi:DNA-binding response OmpR family regulator